jgi:hypothetical protein
MFHKMSSQEEISFGNSYYQSTGFSLCDAVPIKQKH